MYFGTASDSTFAPEAEGGVELLTAGKYYPKADGVIRSFVTGSYQIFYRVFSRDRTVGGFLSAVRPPSSALAREAFALPPGNNALAGCPTPR
jgi:hypothetical protein